MPDDVWQMPEEAPQEPARRSVGARVGRVLVLAAAVAAIGIGGAAAASAAGTSPARSTTPVTGVQNVSPGGVQGAAQDDCPFHHSDRQTTTAGSQG
jgi:hypothetical protein